MSLNFWRDAVARMIERTAATETEDGRNQARGAQYAAQNFIMFAVHTANILFFRQTLSIFLFSFNFRRLASALKLS